jgi:tetratricopeptide (TPR) repeat protein
MFRAFFVFGLLLLAGSLRPAWAADKPRPPALPEVTVRAPGPGCQVDIDGRAAGKTDGRGMLVVPDVEPGDHYLHLRCPNASEKTFFISPLAGKDLALDENKPPEPASQQSDPGSRSAETEIQLRQLVQQAQQMRAQGRLDEAVERLRSAVKLDPANSDLHRELGISFLLGRNWKRARVEMLEAIRNDPTDADAYNGLGYALEKTGELSEALKQYRMATHLDPADPTYRTHYFDMLSKLSQENAKKKQGLGSGD